MSYKITQIDTLLSSLKTNREETPISLARSLDVNIDGSFIVSYPLISSLYHYPQNPNNTNYITNIIQTIQGQSPLDFPLDAKFNNGKIWIADNTRIICLNSYTYEHIISKTLNGIIYAVTPYANGCFISLFNSITSAQILHLDNNCNIISTFSFDATYPLSTLKIERNSTFIESLPSSNSICFDDKRNRLWWINDSIVYMVDILTKTVSTYDLGNINLIYGRTISIDVNTGNAFVVMENYLFDGYIAQMNKDNTECIGVSYLKTTEFSNYFVAGAHGIIYSKDGINWNNSPSESYIFPPDIYGVTWNQDENNKVIVAVGSGPNRIIYSNDGISWNISDNGSSMFSIVATSVFWMKDRFMAGGYYTNSLISSFDGNIWTSVSNPLSVVYCGIYQNEIFIIGGQCPGDKTPLVYSFDGIIWETTNLTPSGAYRGLLYANNIFVAVGGGVSYPITYSYNGIYWIQASGATSSWGGWQGVCYGNNKFVAIGIDGSHPIAYSIDGINWISSNNGAEFFAFGDSVTWGGDKFVAIGRKTETSQKSVIYSYDGITWYPSANGSDFFVGTESGSVCSITV